MNRLLVSLSTVALIAVGSSGFAADQSEPPMHMHKSEMNHNKPDKEVAAEYKSEAQQLREKAESHRKLAQIYRTRTPPKGSGSYESVAQHCDKLAQLYDDAAKEAASVATELRQ